MVGGGGGRGATALPGGSAGRLAPPFWPRQARPLPRKGARGIREAARVDARPPGVATLLFMPIGFGLRAKHPVAFFGGTFMMQQVPLLQFLDVIANTIWS